MEENRGEQYGTSENKRWFLNRSLCFKCFTCHFIAILQEKDPYLLTTYKITSLHLWLGISSGNASSKLPQKAIKNAPKKAALAILS